MIVKVALENWKSFRDRVEFSMVASSERQHGNRVPQVRKYRTRVLPIAAFYGGNASGKSNFFQALQFAKRLVVQRIDPDDVIPVVPFGQDAKWVEQPSRFRFELLIDETIYEFSFAVTQKEVVEEKLVVNGARTETVLYDRRNGKPNFDQILAEDPRLQFVFEGTRENQLFLSNSVSQKVVRFRPVYDWFRKNLVLIGPDSRFAGVARLLDPEERLSSAVAEKLWELDTGIARLGGEEIPLEAVPLLEKVRSDLERLAEGKTVYLPYSPAEQLVVSRKAGKLTVQKVVAYHPKADGGEARFNLGQESDGTQRVIDLLPAFLDLSDQDSKRVYVIDEVDRSLHTLLIRRLVEAYLAGCSTQSRRQLLLTTHDVLLMDQELLRRDEMWVTERDAGGVSKLFSFSDYKDVRYDKDIRKSYLQGRLGGIPRILLQGALSDSCL
ncbi:AAA family ATPase [Methylacidimicrobium tartarophylax]|uniref:ATPase AAA-type core domain-containing protein n=1 Tax=Methylacidimicrobium tartarophylax TaxID=1041768 RepID=A0A5E6MLT4_9BACT|nr:ATP-binding protein [Methylacidimicrobium tartarophylax]VVM07027.1 hypothetical protein MAMT_01512 [Methylacidimicrobium tartarophylax]